MIVNLGMAFVTIRASVPSSDGVTGGPQGFWREISLTSILDILIVAFLIYQLLLLVRGTRASQMLFGIALIVLLYYAAVQWKLQTLHWLLTKMSPILVFALIVIFQAEIRRGLARLGRNPFLSRFARLSRDFSYDDILLAVSLFSSQKTGALIVLERDVGLRTYVDSGIGLDAQLSYDLLVTIFRPETPLHDGGIIIQKDKVAAAACFLPLSVNPLLSTQVGSRHRAAIGITEESDAVAVVVSEQTGEISLAAGGTIEQNVSLERLRVRLGELMGTPISPSVLPTTNLTEQEPPAPGGEGAPGIAVDHPEAPPERNSQTRSPAAKP